MTDGDPREALRELYREGLAKVGFNEAAVQRGLQMLESGRYVGFADVVSLTAGRVLLGRRASARCGNRGAAHEDSGGSDRDRA